ncbi:AAA family ATPase [Dactylosporangium sp. NPDC049525]|uniref:AAA family ATPase n=1 Tax=Dactylosporangium sp. NPDC049525 TaxID=3154730 RepID=UPI00341E6878
MTAHELDREVVKLARTFGLRVEAIKQQFVDRDEVLDVVALAVLCREHVLLVGPPGTAKTSMLQRFAAMLETEPFHYLLTKFTEPAELFGPVDVRRFHEGFYEINTAGMLPTARIAFLDEVFQGSSAILNSLLTLINERVFHNGGRLVNVDLLTLLGATNEVPNDPVLQAFGDRFLFRCRVDYVPDAAVEEMLAMGWKAEREVIRGNGGGPGGRAAVDRFPIEQLKVLQHAVAEIDLGDTRGALADLIKAFREEGIAFSDRRIVKSQRAIAASALLAGRGTATVEDLAPIVHLWSSPQDEVSIRRIVEAQGVPVRSIAAGVRELPEIMFELRRLRRAAPDVGSVEEAREAIRVLGHLVQEIRASHPDAHHELGEAQGAQREYLQLVRDHFTAEESGRV